MTDLGLMKAKRKKGRMPKETFWVRTDMFA